MILKPTACTTWIMSNCSTKSTNAYLHPIHMSHTCRMWSLHKCVLRGNLHSLDGRDDDDVSEQSSVCKTTPFAATFADSTKEAEVENEKAQKAPEAELSDIQKLTQELTSLNVSLSRHVESMEVSQVDAADADITGRTGTSRATDVESRQAKGEGALETNPTKEPQEASEMATLLTTLENLNRSLSQADQSQNHPSESSLASSQRVQSKASQLQVEESVQSSHAKHNARFVVTPGPMHMPSQSQQSQQSGYPGALAAQMAARAAQVSGPSRPCGPCGPWVHSTHCVEAIFPEPVQGGQGVQGVQALPPAEVSAIFDPGVDTQVWFLEEFFSGFIGNSVKPMNCDCEHRARNSGNLKRNAWKWLQVVTWLLSCQKFQTARESQQNTFFLGMPCLRCRRASESLRQHLCQSCSRQRKCLRDASRSDADARCSEGWHDLKIGRSCKSEAKQRNCMELWTMMEGFLQGVRDLKVAKTHKTFLFLSFPLKLCRKSHRMSGKAYKAKWEHLRTSRQNEYSENFEATFEHGPAWTSRSSMLLRRGISELNAALLRKDEDIKDHLHPFLSFFYMLHLAHSWTNNIFIIIVLLYVSSLCRCGWLKFD